MFVPKQKEAPAVQGLLELYSRAIEKKALN